MNKKNQEAISVTNPFGGNSKSKRADRTAGKIQKSFLCRIELKSEVDKGTTFTVAFPKYLPTDKDSMIEFIPEEPVKYEKIVFSAETYDINKYTVLIVEDNLRLLSYLQKSLLPEYNIYYSTNGEEAIDKLAHIPKVDLIISDIMMEKMKCFFNISFPGLAPVHLSFFIFR